MSSVAFAAGFYAAAATVATACGVLAGSYIHIQGVERASRRLHALGIYAAYAVALVVYTVAVVAAIRLAFIPNPTSALPILLLFSATIIHVGPGTASYENARAAYELAQESDDDWTTIHPVDEEAVGDE